MDDMDCFSLTYKKTMDARSIWQWRITHVKKYSRNPESFHYSNNIGLDYYVASERIKKVDLQSVTNGVILEVCDFAKTVIESRKHFITDILENNFDLGFEDEQQRIDFTARILHKVKYLMREVSPAKHEAFTLFNMSSKPQSTSNSENGLNMRSTETESFLEMDDPDESELEDDLKCSELHLQKELLEDLPSSFPYCEEIGLNLDVSSEQSLDPGLFTKGAMLELVSFTRALTSSYSQIILDVLEHNFKLDLKDQQVKNRVWFNISNLLKRRKRLTTTGDQTSPEFENEPFSFQTNPLKGQYGQSDLKSKQQKRALMLTNERVTKRCRREENTHMETNTFSHQTNFCTSGKEEDDVYDFCAPLESDLDLDEDPDSGKGFDEDYLKQQQNTLFVSFSVPSESESEYTITDDSSNMNLPLVSPHNKNRLYRDDRQTQTQRIVLNDYDLEQEEMEPEANMWKLRANRVEQILGAQNKEFGPFTWSSRFGVEFNVGFGPKRNISVDLLTHPVLLEVAKFALAINSSQQDFIMEILEYNFDLGPQGRQHRNVFACEMMKRARQLRRCEDAVKLSDEVFDLLGPMPSTNTANLSVSSAGPELSNISQREKNDVGPVCSSNSHAKTTEQSSLRGMDFYPSCKEHISCKSVDHYPACRGIGLKLHVNYWQPNQKLDINKLTNRAMTEVTNFAEELCGTFQQICLDILRHNFDFDLQSGNSEFSSNILARIHAAVEEKNLSYCAQHSGRKMGKGFTLERKKKDCQNSPALDVCNGGASEEAILDQNEPKSANMELNLRLWKLRTNQIQRFLSMPHEKHCPLYSYSRCTKLGIDFNVGSGVNQNLDPKLLTNGVVVELTTLASALQSAKKYFITEILEYNFDLNFHNELDRSLFAERILKKCQSIKHNKSKVHLLKMPFELPDLSCVQEPSNDRSIYCPKCYQDRNGDAGHMNPPYPHAIINIVSAEANCTAQNPTENLSPSIATVEETIMDRYPVCKEIGLNLFVDKGHPKNKLDKCVLTPSVMIDIDRFAKVLCGSKLKIIHELTEHNFDIKLQCGDINLPLMYRTAKTKNNDKCAWLNEGFIFNPFRPRHPGKVSKVKEADAVYRTDRKETIQKRKLALQAKNASTTLPTDDVSVKKSKTNHQSTDNSYPTCTKMNVDLDVTSNLPEKKKLDLKLLTVGVVLKIHDFASKKVKHYYPRTVFDILDYNFDLSSQYYRRWEFSTATASKIQIMVKQYCDNQVRVNEVFKLPFEMDPEAPQMSANKQNNEGKNSALDTKSGSESSGLGFGASRSPTKNTNGNPPFESLPDEKVLCKRKKQTQTPRKVKHKCDFEQEESETENNMWKSRTNRVEQILSPLNKEHGPFTFSKEIDLEFNVGFGPQQNISVDLLTHPVLLEIAKFALAINSSQQNFIMEILEYNFDLDLQSKQRRHTFACEMMKRARKLRRCEDAVRLSNKVFELLGPMPLTNMANLSVTSAGPELSSISQREKNDFGPWCSADSHGVTEKHISCKSVDLYPACKEIGLKLHDSCGQPHKKLDINKLTNRAMTEVTNFTEKLCGTVEQICLDILRHNFDLNMQSGDPDPTKNVLARIRFAVDEINLQSYANCNHESKHALSSYRRKQGCQNNSNLDASDAGSSQAEIIAQNVANSADVKQEHLFNVRLWKLRTNQIQRILSMPHEKHCPLYSYSRCMKTGIDFNVRSGVKQKLKPLLITNGIMVELSTFATALVSARQHFITEILEHNFNLNFQNELYRSTFAEQIVGKISSLARQGIIGFWELPDMRYIQEPVYDKTTYCPKCYQDRNHVLCQNESDAGHMNHPHPHAVVDTDSAETNCTAQNPTKDLSSSISTLEETIMDRYPLCKKRGLNLFVDRDCPQKKLEMHVLTPSVLIEVDRFAKMLCGSKLKIIHNLVEHNFDLNMQKRDISFGPMLRKAREHKDNRTAWYNHVFIFRVIRDRVPGCASKPKEQATVKRSDQKETIQKSKPTPQTMETEATMPTNKNGIVKSKTNQQSFEESYPICTEIGLDLDVTCESGEKQKLDLKLLTNAVVREIHKFAIQKEHQHFPTVVFDILDYNFDLSSQHYRRSQFALATASKVLVIARQFCRRQRGISDVFELPFVFPLKRSQRLTEKSQKMKRKMSTQKEPDMKRNEGRGLHQVRYSVGANCVTLGDVETSMESWSHDEDTKPPIFSGTHNVQINESVTSEGCGWPLLENMWIKEEEYDPHYGDEKREPNTEENYQPCYDIVKMEFDAGHVEPAVQTEPAGSHGYTLTMCPKSGSNVKTESETEGSQSSVPAEPQGYEGNAMLAVMLQAESDTKTESNTADVEYKVPAGVRASQECSMVIIGQSNGSMLITEEKENMSSDSCLYGAVSFIKRDADIKQEEDT